MKFKSKFLAVVLSIVLVTGVCFGIERVVTVGGSSPYRNLTDFVTGAQAFGSGNTFYVDSDMSTSGNGDQWTGAVKTLNEAFALCTANNGDIVLVAAGHSEAIAAANGVRYSVAGVRVIGYGEGALRPTLTYSATASDLEVDAADCTLENFIVDLTGIDAVAAGIDVNAAGFKMINCRVVLADGTGQCTLGMELDANADRLVIDNCEFYGSSDAGATAGISAVATTPDDILIKNSHFYGDFATAAVTGSGAVTNLVLVDSYFQNLQTGDHAVEFPAAASGWAKDCLIVTDATATSFDGNAMFIMNVLWCDSDVADTAAVAPTYGT